MKPVLDWNDDDEDDDDDFEGTLKSKADGGENGGSGAQYSMEKYFSNGDVDRGHKASDNFGRRNGRARRYSGDNNDPNTGGGFTGYDDDERDSSDEDELERGGGDLLGLEELDGWMNEINSKRVSGEDF